MSLVSRETPSLQWHHWPPRSHPFKLLIFLGTISLLVFVAGSLAHSFGMGLLAGVALAVSCWRFWFPISIELGPNGVTEQVWGMQRQLPWKMFATYRTLRSGVILLPGETSSRTRGCYIPWSGRRAEILSAITHYLDQ